VRVRVEEAGQQGQRRPVSLSNLLDQSHAGAGAQPPSGKGGGEGRGSMEQE